MEGRRRVGGGERRKKGRREKGEGKGRREDSPEDVALRDGLRHKRVVWQQLAAAAEAQRALLDGRVDAAHGTAHPSRYLRQTPGGIRRIECWKCLVAGRGGAPFRD